MSSRKTVKRQKAIHNSPSHAATNCMRCGTCCRKGGPALHKEDIKIILAGHIDREALITLRKGELAFSPLSSRLEPVQKEIVKLAGKRKGWDCCFFDEKKSACIVYAYRPLECRLLKCWDTAGLLSVIGQNTLDRFDIISKDDPLLPFIKIHEKECSMEKAEGLISAFVKKKDNAALLDKITALAQRDLTLRSQAVAQFGLSLGEELFAFGRPLFKILGARGFQLMDKICG
ncbi:MAG: YkgJ family cysteine cluster protein [Nitrospirota bacterium]|nr:YkgJ family cysteine cluster protein [Nitrospirota bacterium]